MIPPVGGTWNNHMFRDRWEESGYQGLTANKSLSGFLSRRSVHSVHSQQR